jgi:uncharacterized protein YceK
MYICSMKNIVALLVICIIMSSCSKDVYSVKKPTRKQIRNGMKYSTWEYKLPTQSMYSNYKWSSYEN